ncbi:dipeptide/oligopeptide/nickel ABC transporter permease/ATP-binding protein [Microbacterium sp. P06]|uniref:dipeptide/oligopeptide/nickel ABC transporter permease/ATP-binding protein n=1 Tax=Microbacterium sp. P06 TaxID=3366949 RepID=UPI0037451116
MSIPEPASVSIDTSAPASLRRLRRFVRNPLGMGAALILAVITISSLLAPLLSPHDPNLIVLSQTLLGPTADHPLGTDASGRDVLSRLLYGGRVSLEAGAIMIVTATVIGIPFGLLAGYYSKWIDGISSWVANLLMSLPEILIIVVVITSLGSGLVPTMVTLGILASPDLFRLTRSVVVNVRSELYIDAARVSGLRNGRIIFRHVLGVVLGPVLVRASFVFGLAIIVQSGLEFLGFGDPTRPSWGGMLSEAFQTFYRAPQLVFAPGAAIGLTVMSLVVLGAAVADALGTDRAAAPRPRATRGTAKTPAVAAASTATGTVRAGTDDALLRVEGLRVSYPGADGSEKVVLHGADLHVERGEVLGIVGESGSGKSQLAFGILGLLPPEAIVSAAEVTLDGASLLGRSERALQAVRGTKIAYVPQEPMSNLDPSFTVGSQLMRPIRYKLGLSRSEAHQRALDLLKRVGIPDPARTMRAYPHELSGGMAQRVLIAGAVSCDPELLIADEPTTALDVTVQAEVLGLLRELQQERNMGMILVTHNLGVVADICDRVAVVRTGEIVETRPVAELFADPAHPYTRQLLASTLEDAPTRGERAAAGSAS